MAATFLNLGMYFDYDDSSYAIVEKEKMIPKTHEYLFRFLEANLSRLETYAETYLRCIDTVHPENSKPGDDAILQRIFEELSAIHPFFSVVSSNMSAKINTAFAGYIKKQFPKNEELQITLMDLICTDKYLGAKNPEHWLSVAPVMTEQVFGSLFDLKKNIGTWVYMTLDNTNPDFARLSAKQRAAVYGLLFSGEYVPVLETRMERNIVCPSGLSVKYDFDNLDSSESESKRTQIFKSIDALRRDSAIATPDCVNELLAYAENISDDCERCTYITETLEALLTLEVYEMSSADVRIKRCKNCGRYFVVGKTNVEYCDRIAAGETKPCSEIGKSRTYAKRLTGGESVMAVYRKAYKTHYARIRSGNMTRDEFDAWKDEATGKREDVEAGRLDFSDYTLWLKL